jgi:hypothetical protein
VRSPLSQAEMQIWRTTLAVVTGVGERQQIILTAGRRDRRSAMSATDDDGVALCQQLQALAIPAADAEPALDQRFDRRAE